MNSSDLGYTIGRGPFAPPARAVAVGGKPRTPPKSQEFVLHGLHSRPCPVTPGITVAPRATSWPEIPWPGAGLDLALTSSMDLYKERGRSSRRGLIAHRSTLLMTLLLCAMAPLPCLAQEADSYEELNDGYEAYVDRSEKEYRAFLDETDRQYDEFVREIERRWGKFVPSTRPMWATYATDLQTRGEVHFDKGTVVVELLADSETPPTEAELSRQLSDQAQAMMKQALSTPLIQTGPL